MSSRPPNEEERDRYAAQPETGREVPGAGFYRPHRGGRRGLDRGHLWQARSRVLPLFPSRNGLGLHRRIFRRHAPLAGRDRRQRHNHREGGQRHMTDDNPAIAHELAVPVKVKPVATPMTMIEKLISKGATAETLGPLVALQERWEANEARKAFANDLADAKGKFTPILKRREAEFDTRTAGRASYRYEGLDDIAEVVDPILAEHGIMVTFDAPKPEGGVITVTCVLTHRLGHVHRGATASAGADKTGSKNDVQAVGSTLTYLQRYTERLTLGLATTKDDDAKKGGRDPDDPKLKAITADQYEELNGLLDKCNESEDRLLDALGMQPSITMHDFLVKDYDRAKAFMLNAIRLLKEKREEAQR